METIRDYDKLNNNEDSNSKISGEDTDMDRNIFENFYIIVQFAFFSEVFSLSQRNVYTGMTVSVQVWAPVIRKSLFNRKIKLNKIWIEFF